MEGYLNKTVSEVANKLLSPIVDYFINNPNVLTGTKEEILYKLKQSLDLNQSLTPAPVMASLAPALSGLSLNNLTGALAPGAGAKAAKPKKSDAQNITVDEYLVQRATGAKICGYRF